MSTVVLGFDTHLLNILPDDKERSEMGVERGWLKLRENFYGGEQFCSGTTSRRLELCGRSRVALGPKLLSAPPEKLRCRQFTGTTRRDYSRPSGCLVREPPSSGPAQSKPTAGYERLRERQRSNQCLGDQLQRPKPAGGMYITEGQISVDGTELQGTNDKKLGMNCGKQKYPSSQRLIKMRSTASLISQRGQQCPPGDAMHLSRTGEHSDRAGKVALTCAGCCRDGGKEEDGCENV